MKKALLVTLCLILALYLLCGCASWDRVVVDLKSDISGGLNRTINVYSADGKLMRTYTGKIDIAIADGGYIKFDMNGKRYIYYNCFVETIAEIN